MKWYWIALITYTVMCIITLIIAEIDEDKALHWAVGIPFLIAYVLLYPVRAWVKYDRSKNYYKKHNITKVQYIFGKRVKDD